MLEDIYCISRKSAESWVYIAFAECYVSNPKIGLQAYIVLSRREIPWWQILYAQLGH